LNGKIEVQKNLDLSIQRNSIIFTITSLSVANFANLCKTAPQKAKGVEKWMRIELVGKVEKVEK
jgi:hypothetical protein